MVQGRTFCVGDRLTTESGADAGDWKGKSGFQPIWPPYRATRAMACHGEATAYGFIDIFWFVSNTFYRSLF